MVDWQVGDLEVEWTSELLLALIADAALHPQANPDEDLAANLGYLLLRVGLPHADAHYLNRIGDKNGGLGALNERINEQFWHLVLRGVLVPSGGRFAVTKTGSTALAAAEGDARVALVADGLRHALEARCPDIDPVALRYAELAQDCFFSGHYEGSVMLLGAASEILIDELVNILNERASEIGVPPIEAQTARSRLETVRSVVADHRKSLKAAVVAAGGDGNWLSDLPGLLDSANAIRLTRNDTGHPSRTLPRRYEAHGALVMFPHLAEALVATAREIRNDSTGWGGAESEVLGVQGAGALTSNMNRL